MPKDPTKPREPVKPQKPEKNTQQLDIPWYTPGKGLYKMYFGIKNTIEHRKAMKEYKDDMLNYEQQMALYNKDAEIFREKQNQYYVELAQW